MIRPYRPYRLLAPALALFLAACAAPGPRPTPKPPAKPVASVPARSPSAPRVITKPAVQPPGLWTRMRARFAMNDCDADPAIMQWAHRFTRHKRSFQAYLEHVQPTIAYIEEVAEKNGVPSEFALLPWVESHYRAVPPRRHRPAGMWQIMAITARTLGLPIHRDYDARLDRVAATAAVMHMLKGYDRRWQDWRLADMAFNAGQYRIRRLHPHGPAPAEPVIPNLAVSRTTRQHLTKLLAISCVIRDPQRFHVHLPKMRAAARLDVLELPAPTAMRDIAKTSGLSVKRVRALNASYRHGRMPARGPWRVMLPYAHAQRLRLALAAGRVPKQPVFHTVVPGDTLWGIAQRNDISVDRLRALNNLHGASLHPGQILRISTAD